MTALATVLEAVVAFAMLAAILAVLVGGTAAGYEAVSHHEHRVQMRREVLRAEHRIHFLAADAFGQMLEEARLAGSDSTGESSTGNTKKSES